MRVALHEQWAFVAPFGKPEWRTAFPGFEVAEIEPWQEGAQAWRHHVDVAGGFAASQYVGDIVDVEAIQFPTRRLACARGPGLHPNRD